MEKDRNGQAPLLLACFTPEADNGAFLKGNGKSSAFPDDDSGIWLCRHYILTVALTASLKNRRHVPAGSNLNVSHTQKMKPGTSSNLNPSFKIPKRSRLQ